MSHVPDSIPQHGRTDNIFRETLTSKAALLIAYCYSVKVRYLSI